MPTKKEIEETLRNKLAKSYKVKIDALQEKVVYWSDKYFELLKRYQDLKESLSILQEKIDQYEDWIHRLQEFCNIPDDEERKSAVEQYLNDKKFENVLSEFLDHSLFFNILDMKK
jgi:chromosome segregation ATPase